MGDKEFTLHIILIPVMAFCPAALVLRTVHHM